ncbi:MAG: hypothetical protein H0A75_04230 [Candidatus Methanofishera endochildressiae]|uniref:Uncharacterized protein n=1 Tax=Candidatus Methanofishera endochildressiae TaxID=2738884 RepID=A0A7Z0MNH1_9GAMM|nr:hypothetical protein [Candidatus Methanofishera endochildressiae]
MLFWLINFCIALGQMVLAGAFASYYWTFYKPADLPMFPLTGSLWRSLRYHVIQIFLLKIIFFYNAVLIFFVSWSLTQKVIFLDSSQLTKHSLTLLLHL